MTNSYDPNATLDFAYDSEIQEAEIQQKAEQERQAELAAKQQQEAEQKTEVPEPKAEDGKFMDDLVQPFIEQGQAENINDMGGRQRAVAGTIDLAMDGLSKVIPALTPAADWWDEKSGRKTETDPMKKATRDAGGMILGTLLTGGMAGGLLSKVPGAAGMGARTKFFSQAALDLGIDAALSGVSDTTSEAGNLATAFESVMPNGLSIPWASRDGESPDVIYAKNMIENMMLAGSGELIGGFFALKGGNTIKPLNQKAINAVVKKQEDELAAIQAAGGDPLLASIMETRQMKQSAQLAEGRRVMMEDPEGVMGYNAFVNEPAEPIARITLDEKASAVDFMADQARIQNNVGTFEGRSRPLADNEVINQLSRADEATRVEILERLDGELGAEFELTVGGTKLTKQDVAKAVDNLYDAAIVSDESFPDAVKSYNDLQVSLLNMSETVADKGQQEILKRTASRLVDAISPYKQRVSAAIQTQTAGSVSDIARNIDLMADVEDTSRLQELVFPRLRTLLKEAETSKVSVKTSNMLKAKIKAKAESIEGLLDLDESFLDDMMAQYDEAVTASGRRIDTFVDELESISKENPNYLRPLYRMWAKTNGEIDTLYKMQKHVDNRLGIIRKAFVDGNSDIPSVILRELQGLRMGNILNGLAPAKAWIGNGMSMVMKPVTAMAGAIPTALKGDLKPIHRAWYTYSGGMETFNRARKMAIQEWRFANANPDAAMARGRADYNMSDVAEPGANDWKKSLSDFEEFEELSETWSPGKKAVWNLTKTIANWNRKSWNRWGIHAMYSADGMVKSMMASASARGSAFDKLYNETNGAINAADFQRIEKELYAQTFDASGALKDGYAKFASEEVALNADVPMFNAFEKVMDNFPILKSIFMFPTTRANQFGVVQTFDPTGLLSGYQDKSFKVINAKTQDEIQDALDMHGMRGASMEEFQMLKSEYIGRKMMTSGIVMSVAIAAANGKIVGTGPSNPADNKAWRQLGGQPFTINLGSDEEPNIISYESLPVWARSFIAMTTDITREFTDVDGDIAEDWYRTLAASLSANVTNDLFGSEIEALAGLMQLKPGEYQRYAANLTDSLIPGAGVRSTLSSVLVPNLQDVEANWQNFLANRNRWIPSIDAKLANDTDIFTGEPIGAGSSPVEILASKLLPGFKTKAGLEPWRQWLLSTGWNGLSKPLTDKLTLEELTPETRQWINNWIGTNLELDKEVDKLMRWDGGKWQKELKKYAKKKGLRSQKDFPIKETFIHEYMDDMVQDAYDQAWAAYSAMNEGYADMGTLKEARDKALNNNKLDKASDLADRINELRSSVK